LLAVPVEQPGRIPIGVFAVGGEEPLLCSAGALAQLDDVGFHLMDLHVEGVELRPA
jgi:hypothetical protein